MVVTINTLTVFTEGHYLYYKVFVLMTEPKSEVDENSKS